jgi:hypothetical protein
MGYPILLIVGPAGSGKDSVADALAANIYGSENIALASPLKEIAKAVFGFSDRQLYGPSEARSEEIPNKPNYRAAEKWIAGVFGGRYSAFLEWARKHIEGRETVSARHVLQTFGTEFGRAIDPDIWIKIALETAKNDIESGASLVIITDGRFRNEALRVKEVGGKILRINSHDSAFTGNHLSETEMKSIPSIWYDYEFVNPKTGKDKLASQLKDAGILPYKV